MKLRKNDRSDWVLNYLVESWGSAQLLSRDRTYELAELANIAAYSGMEPAGLLTYYLYDAHLEIVTLNAIKQSQGVGTLLLTAAREAALARGLNRMALITTNDNLAALRFYQRRGFRIVRVFPEAVTRARLRKPEIPLMGESGIELRDELELELILD